MKTLLIAALVLAAPVAFAQGDATGADAAKAKPAAKDGGTEAAEAPPPDVSKLPFSPESIKTVIAYHQPKIQGCYEDMLAGMKKPEEGKLMTSFVITAEGLVKSPKVEKKGTTLKNGKLHDCVVAVLAGMEFPKPPGGREQPIEYPFNLKAIK